MIKIIKSNFELKIAGIKEFIRILIPEAKDDNIEINLIKENKEIILELKKEDKKIKFSESNIDGFEEQKKIMAKSGLLKLYDKKYKWGSLTGVRLTKLVRKFMDKRFSIDKIKYLLEKIYLVSEDKIDLLLEIVETELKYLNRKAITVYIGIPYCPTKCTYCSFASYEKKGKMGERYGDFLEKLLEEIKIIGELTKELEVGIESIYIGGGTPAILSEYEMESLLKKVRENFDISNLKEFTFEAGRSDVLNEKKLEILKKYGVDRISLNPQTFNEDTLMKVNRVFNREKFDKMYEISKKIGLIINMDFIIGLPGETTEDILETIKNIKKYDMENLTIHMLALKKASKLYKKGHEIEELNGEKLEKALKEVLNEKKLAPYYMYRQKNSADWGENIGYSVKGKESVFNIQVIEENQTTIGIGGGAITKFVNGEDITRLINPKDPIIYIKEFDERLKNKVQKIKKELH
ncbi:coproporphyrinogen III oxidase [Haliovirga abyssi]|uniref:Coproporphyrinogen III oxidase n=1 Tax=Haliovirga abyssi TaxID=2996794 RepID=A0AAU9DFT3_9FUSO|nr:coproporphyrinogen III oxidase [Haliovirga abyssi]BDU51302.1 coproporphyrinogen III oxidase [Haliovirga abyssi]